MKQIDIIDALRDRRLPGRVFPDLSSWGAWLVFFKAVFGVSDHVKLPPL